MNRPFDPHLRKRAQTLVFFALAFGTIFLLCGLAIDSGLLYLAKARLSRSVDGAALAAVGNFSLGRDQVALTMRNFAVANYTDLGLSHNSGSMIADNAIASTATGVQSFYTLPNGQPGSIWTYNFSDGVQDANGAYRKYVKVVLTLGAGNQITNAVCYARCPVRTYFMWFAGSFFKDLKVSASAAATRNPRLIMVVVDRSASMLEAGGGAYTLPNAIISFLNFFDTSSDYIGIVSFGSNARLEMPLTTNFLFAGTNVLYDSYQSNGAYYSVTAQYNGIPGVDPEEYPSDGAGYEPNYTNSGIRRMKFGGSTCADEGIRLGLETMMANSSFNDPDVTKYMVIFTDGKWNCVRTLLAAPGYTNTVTSPPAASATVFVTNSDASVASGTLNPTGTATNYQYTVPSLSPYVYMTNALTINNSALGIDWDYYNHTNDVWQSLDASGYEPPSPTPPSSSTLVEGLPTNVISSPYLGTNSATGQAVYTTSLNVWLPPGAVDYVYDNTGGGPIAAYVSNLNHPTNTVAVDIPSGGSNVLVVPGYLIDGTFTDQICLPYPDEGGSYTCYRYDNFLTPGAWPDDGLASNPTETTVTNDTNSVTNPSQMRRLMFRNYANLLTGYFIYRADDPLQTQTSTTGFEPLAKTDAYPNGYPRPLYGLGAYYPSSGVYWPFDLANFCNLSSTYSEQDPTYQATDATLDQDLRGISWTINMLSTNAAPNWAGELFYGGLTGTNSAVGLSTQINSSSTWENGASSVAPGTSQQGWLENFITAGHRVGILLDDTTHYGSGGTNIINGLVLRPASFNGGLDLNPSSPTTVGNVGANPTSASVPVSEVAPGGSVTGGYVMDDTGNVYSNAMAYSGRPTHYYDFSQSKWVAVSDNHNWGNMVTGLGYWKAQEYAWHARAMGVTIFTVGYGSIIDDPECVILAKMANATNVSLVEGNSTNFLPASYNTAQPIGQQFFATTNSQIITDFQTIGTVINTALTQ